MPRLLPRLLRHLSKHPLAQERYQGQISVSRRKRRSLWKPTAAIKDDLFELDERKQSLLLDSKDSNIFATPRTFKKHKTLPPKKNIDGRQEFSSVYPNEQLEMTPRERMWWTNPYLRVMSSPVRKCIKTRHYLPSDLLIRFVAVRVPADDGGGFAFVPDGVQHPRFSSRVSGIARYLACNKEVVMAHNAETTSHRFHRPPVMESQVSHLLRLRVLQELDILASKLAAGHPSLTGDSILRRLTWDEWLLMRQTNAVPWEGSLCVLVMPPPNRHRVQKTHRAVSLGVVSPSDAPSPANNTAISEPCWSSKNEWEELLEDVDDVHLPKHRVPLYHGVPLFPSPEHRSAIHGRLCRILKVERNARRRMQHGPHDNIRNQSSKASHAFLLASTSKTMSQVDSVPLAIALWRLKLWEGAEWPLLCNSKELA